MTLKEFSREFDILYNNLASNTAPPINEYEKSVFLTKAQSDIVLELYSGRNSLGLSYETSEEVKKYLENLYTEQTQQIDFTEKTPTRWIIDEGSFDPIIWLITREEIIPQSESLEDAIPVIPITQDDYSKIRKNPFKGASKRRALRLAGSTAQGRCDCILYKAQDPIQYIKYTVCGMRYPLPIILEDIDDDTLTISGYAVTEAKGCELDTSLHYAILERAVLYAKQALVGTQSQEH